MTLCSLEDVRLHQQLNDNAITQADEIVEALIIAASDLISRYTQREFVSPHETPGHPSAVLSRQFRYDGLGVVDLAPYDLQSASSVKIAADTDNPVTLDSSRYRLWPIPARDGVYHTLHLDPDLTDLSHVSTWPVFDVVEITGEWGFPSVPEVVKRAAVMLTMELLSRTSAWKNTTFETLADSAPMAAIPMHVRTMLSSYRRFSVGF